MVRGEKEEARAERPEVRGKRLEARAERPEARVGRPEARVENKRVEKADMNNKERYIYINSHLNIYILRILVLSACFASVDATALEITQEPDTTTIKSLVATMSHQDSLFVGTAVHLSNLGNTQTETIIRREFDYLTPANEFKQSYIHPSPGVWKWQKPDDQARFARSAGQLLRMHAPISPQVSAWAKTDSRTPGELEQNLVEYMSELCKHYNDSSHIIWLDVVNEILTDNGSWFGPKEGTSSWENPWPKMGYDESVALRPPLYIKRAFEVANEYGPDLKLIINQHALTRASWEKMKAVTMYLRDLGLRVDGLGWQAHLTLGWEEEKANFELLTEAIDWCHANDLEFHITEFNMWLRGDDAGKWREQAEAFYAVTKTAASRYNRGVVGINYWHIRGTETQHKDRDGGLWAEDYHPKQSYYDIKRALYEIEMGIGPSISSSPSTSAIKGETYSYQVKTFGDIGEVEFVMNAGPQDWLSIDENGVLSGTPVETGSYDISLIITDEIGPRTQDFQLHVYSEALSITSDPVVTATTEIPYEYQVSWTGGGDFILETSRPADWLSIDENGLLSGTPIIAENLTVKLFLYRGSDTLVQDWILRIDEKLKITSAPKTQAHEGNEYRYQVDYQGLGAFSLETTPETDWLSISISGLLKGTPPGPDTIHVKITAQNNQTTVFQEFDLEIEKALELTSIPLREALEGVEYRYQLEFEGEGSFELKSSPDAPWLSIDQDGLLSGTPLELDTFKITIKFYNEVYTRYQVFTLYVYSQYGVEEGAGKIVSIYPNPARDRLFIKGLLPGETVKIFNLLGIVRKEIEISSSKQEIDVSNLHKGYYFLKYMNSAYPFTLIE